MTVAHDGDDPEKIAREETASEEAASEETGAAPPGQQKLANAYLDFWQLNLMRWSTEPRLIEDWAARILDPSTAAPGREEE